MADEESRDAANVELPTPRDIIGLAKLASTAVMRTAGAVTKGSVDIANVIAHGLVAGEPVSQIIDETAEHLRATVSQMIAGGDADASAHTEGVTAKELEAEGARLLYLSWSPDNQPHDIHPAFKPILRSLTPDEARILRFLAVAGPQPSLDLRTKTPFQVGSERIAAGINMVANMAGCTWIDRGNNYLANLFRLGLIRFSAEPVDDFRRYSLLTAQPAAIDAYHKRKKIQPVFRSIYLSPFGEQFAEICIPASGYDAGGWADNTRNDHIAGRSRQPRKDKH